MKGEPKGSPFTFGYAELKVGEIGYVELKVREIGYAELKVRVR